jgi:hypothetical protein
MNTGLKILLLHWILFGCASAPKPVTKKKVGPAATTKTVKGKGPAKAPAKAVPPPVEEEAEHEEEEDDQFSRIKKYYKK